METVWEYSLDTETQRFLHHARQIAVGFYKLNGFTVVPFGTKTTDSSIVTFPDIKYVKIPRFWDKVSKIDISNFPLKISSELFNQTRDLLNEYELPEPHYQKVQELWRTAEKEIISEIENLLPSKKGKLQKIIIHPTVFGTPCSFNRIDDRNTAIIYLREDQGINKIVEALLSILTRDDAFDKLGGVWQEAEIIVDFLVTQTKLHKVFEKYDPNENYSPTVKSTRNKEKREELQNQSIKFYEKMGLVRSEKAFSLKGRKPLFADKTIDNLNRKEEKLLNFFISKSNKIISYDDIANIIFVSEDEFSLEAIAKVIQRLRDKLEDNGISGSYLQTIRKRGYVLRN